ncbi:MAG: secondary thiamine-phosphate synthase enzyme YjbQ [Cyanobacteriota bacterium]
MLQPGCDNVAMLHQSLHTLALSTHGQGFTDITAELNGSIAASGLATGIAVISCLHTSCSLIVSENADPRVLVDLAEYLKALVPEDEIAYSHSEEGSDDMPAHIRTVLTSTSLSFSFLQGRLLLGIWQAIYLWEHRAMPHHRRLHVHLIGQ